jgi:hypothetical protein
MEKNTCNIVIQIYSYSRESLIRKVSELIPALISGGVEWVAEGVDKEGKKRITHCKTPTEALDRLQKKFEHGLNAFSLTGSNNLYFNKIELEKIFVTGDVSPLSSEWRDLGDLSEEYLQSLSRPHRKFLLSASSVENFIKLNGIKKHPNGVIFKFFSEVGLGELLNNCDCFFKKASYIFGDDLIIHIDGAPSFPVLTTMEMIGGNSLYAERFLEYFDRAHWVTIGRFLTINSYARDIKENWRGVDFVNIELGKLCVVGFEDMRQIKSFKLNKWHFGRVL